ncbi:Dam family site-specific DNA-(adenine-N6)-methyltransferase [Ruminococcus albus]|uniref:Site-specific DNA-methyltransferase (adenine-specific) n=1 Tax=Ruminococcus albus 8 TaxID=246199 RepID=E9SFV5_RUMAL|nr:Dam family site-specific DNA-(adenine-N6)-methyltransferase [Ruminococcus albus]EGC01922.1 DNA adenine methylase [Ruminococcus albus 8]MCC3352820.1 Dam family site-specific DNA-(adenine-N6)-methyltransferase [Ruminococcus albus 8]
MSVKTTKAPVAKPILKWAGGKTQMLGELMPRVPKTYGRYIEPFFGGGALFFSLKPENAIIADSNPELINMYLQVAHHVDDVIECLQKYENTSEMFYEVRSLDWQTLPKAEAAARTIYLNKTCFNGLYRVNRSGQFNTPFGKYKNPKICDIDALRLASEALRKAEILCGDYILVLEHYAQPGDFVFLDPPYLPISENSDFKRYTKEQFYEDDHVELAKMIGTLHERGCYVILTNSNHPLVHQLYERYKIEVIQTKRHISCHGDTRKGEDVIVTIPPEKKKMVKSEPLSDQVSLYPPTRFMGSKRKLLGEIWNVASRFEFDTVVDLFSGSGIVGYMFKSHGKTVISNDYMAMSATFTKAMVENNTVTLPIAEAEKLLIKQGEVDHFVSDTFKDLYYTDDENELIDILRTNIAAIDDQYKKAIAMTALIRACTKKRPRGIFTYTGHRYDDGRKDLQKTLSQQFLEAVEAVNNAVFDNHKANKSVNGDAMALDVEKPDLVYIDPPYYSPLSDNEYVRRYHFIEGLARDWKGVEIQEHTKTKKFKSYPTPFSTKNGAYEAFDKLFSKFSDSILIVSYSSNSLPTQEDMVALMKKYKEHVEVVPVDYKYAFGNQADAKTHRNSVQEYLFIGY